MKQSGIILLMLLCTAPVVAQAEKLDSLLTDVLGDDKKLYRLLNPSSVYIYSGIAYDNKTLYAGRELGDNMHTVNGNVYIVHSRGFYIGASGTWYSGLDPAYNATVLSAGIIKPLNKSRNMSLRASYSRFIFSSTDSVTNSFLNNNLGVGLTMRNKYIGGRLTFNALFGKDLGMNFEPALFGNVILAMFGTFNKIFLAPEISAFFGSETIEYESSGSAIDPQSLSYSTTDKYGLLNTKVTLPICIYLGNFDVELSYSINIPTTRAYSVSNPVSTYFSLSIGFLLPLN
jgi:hypothetical protein